MAFNLVGAAELAARDARPAFVETYKEQITKSHALLSKVMDLGLTSTYASEDYPYPESAPHPRRVEKGQASPHEGFRSRKFNVVNHKWKLAIDVHEDDLADDQVGGIMQQVRDGGTNFGILDERVFFQILTGGTDSDLLPAVPNAPDGSALFVSTTRFGNSGGNIISGGGTPNTTAIITTDVWKAYSRLVLFQGTKGQPLWPPESIKELVVIYPAAHEEFFRKAFQSSTVQGSSAGISNINREAQGVAFTLWGSPRLSGDDWYVIAVTNRKCIFKQTRMPLTDNLANFTNSDQAREYDVMSWYWKWRGGYGVSLPTMAIKIDNA